MAIPGYQKTLIADLPNPASVPINTCYFVTQSQQWYYNNGTGWVIAVQSGDLGDITVTDNVWTVNELPQSRITNLTTDLGLINSELTTKQDILISGTNIKTVNGNSLLGSGDIVVSGGGAVTDGDKGDITVSSSGLVWTVDELNSLKSRITALENQIGSGVVTDPLASAVLSLIHFNGNHNANTFTDQIATNTISTFGQPITSIAQSKFNGSSGYFDGNSYVQVTFPQPLGTFPFTIEFWVYALNSTNYHLINSRTNGIEADGFDFWNDRLSTAGKMLYWTPPILIANQWQHLAIVGNELNNLDLFVDGQKVCTGANFANSLSNFIKIGGNADNNGGGNVGYLTGFIADFRVTSVPRYSDNFAVPTATFPNP